MKKYFVIVLAALLLVCAVSCDDSKKNLGTLVVYTKGITEYADEGVDPFEGVEKAYFEFETNNARDIAETHHGIPVSLEAVKNGKVVIPMTAGAYLECKIVLANTEDETTEYPLYETIKDVELVPEEGDYVGIERLVIDAGQKTYALCYMIPQ